MPKLAPKPAPAPKKTKPTANASAPAKQRSSETQSQAPRNLVKSTLPADLDLNLGSSTTLKPAPETLDAALIPVTQGEIGGVKCLVVEAKALHAYLGCARHFPTWIVGKINKFEFVEHSDFIKNKSGFNSGPGRKELVYTLSLDMAKELAMVENNKMGLKARRYFIDCERKLMTAQGHTPTPVLPVAPAPSKKVEESSDLMLPSLLDEKGNPYKNHSIKRHVMGLSRVLSKRPRHVAYKEYARSLAITGGADENLAQKMADYAYSQSLKEQIENLHAAVRMDSGVARNLLTLEKALDKANVTTEIG